VVESASPHVLAAEAPMVLLESALADLDAVISFSADVTAPSHTAVIVDGLDDPCVPGALGRYLVGALAGAVDIDASLCEDLLAHGADRRAEITSSVIGIIAETNVFSTAEAEVFRDTRRNAWIGEGVGHALLMLAARHETSFVRGRVCTLSEVHQSPTRQGLDSVSTYVSNSARRRRYSYRSTAASTDLTCVQGWLPSGASCQTSWPSRFLTRSGATTAATCP
jgi:hypothetical protein